MYKKVSATPHELELQAWIGISPIFNVVHLYKYKGGDTSQQEEQEDILEPKVQCTTKIPSTTTQEHKGVYKKNDR